MEFVVFYVCGVCVAESNRHVLVEAGGAEVFSQLLNSPDQDIQFYCAAALSNLAVHGEPACQPASQPASQPGQGTG